MQLFGHRNRLIDLSSWSRSVAFQGCAQLPKSIEFVLADGPSVEDPQGTQIGFCLSLGYLFCGSIVMRIRVFASAAISGTQGPRHGLLVRVLVIETNPEEKIYR